MFYWITLVEVVQWTFLCLNWFMSVTLKKIMFKLCFHLQYIQFDLNLFKKNFERGTLSSQKISKNLLPEVRTIFFWLVSPFGVTNQTDIVCEHRKCKQSIAEVFSSASSIDLVVQRVVKRASEPLVSSITSLPFIRLLKIVNNIRWQALTHSEKFIMVKKWR